ncbi:MAG: RNA polymerase subunit sigma-70 [Thermoleophilia bacterium]
MGATAEGDAVMAAVRDGDEAAFGALVERHRGELQVHCYRMLGSLEDAEDAVQETFLRAWRRRDGFEGRGPFRAWLYGIATNACLDDVARRGRRVPTTTGQASPADVPWVGPYPDHLLALAAPTEDEPERVVVTRETIEMAFMVAVQHLPPAQRAVLILRDVLGWSAKETAEPLDASVAAVNSSLQRARATLRERQLVRGDERAPDADPTEEERALVARYIAASERDDVEGLAAMMAEDARFSMPETWVGRDTIVKSWVEGGWGSAEFGRIRCVATRANMQPAVANYLQRPGDDAYRAMAMDILRIEDGVIMDIDTYGPDVFAAFGLPDRL